MTLDIQKLLRDAYKEACKPLYIDVNPTESYNQQLQRIMDESSKLDPVALLLADYKKKGSVYVNSEYDDDSIDVGKYASFSYKFITSVVPRPERKVKPKEPPFEVNMMEALVGWKAWQIVGGRVVSASLGTKWNPCEPLVAKCECKPNITFFRYADEEVLEEPKSPLCDDTPQESGQCGVYAAGKREEAEQYTKKSNSWYPWDSTTPDPTAFIGEIYGWGRYVRGNSGWRSQFAYPKCFYLRPSQVEFIDVLREFRVPIYVEQPIKVYSPEEDSYSEYRQNEENWDIGTAADSNPSED